MSTFTRSAIKAPEPGQALTPDDQVRWDLVVAAVAFVVVVIDQITKALIRGHFTGRHLYDSVPLIGNILSLEFDKNTGAAFSSFTNSPVLLGFLILIAVGVIAYMYWSNRARNYPLLKVTFGLIAGGAVGNLIDRVTLGYVTDFVHFQLPAIHFDFAIFNIADSAISIGVVLLAFVFWTLPRESVPAPGEDAPTDGGAAVKADAPPTVADADATQSPATPPAKKTPPTNVAKATTSAISVAAKRTTTNGAKPTPGAKTPTNPLKTTVSAAKTTAGATSLKAPVATTVKPSGKGAPVATAARSGTSSKSKGKRRS